MFVGLQTWAKHCIAMCLQLSESVGMMDDTGSPTRAMVKSMVNFILLFWDERWTRMLSYNYSLMAHLLKGRISGPSSILVPLILSTRAPIFPSD